jgi:hypothetical protein
MNMPGYTAERSVYKSSTSYQLRGTAHRESRDPVGPAIAFHSRFLGPFLPPVGIDVDCYRTCALQCGSDARCQNHCIQRCEYF